MSARRPTIHTVAQRAGVSATTVSFVLNDAPHARVSPATRERVVAAAAELGYRPNSVAKSLRTARSRSIGFITDHIAASQYAGDVIRGAHDRAWSAGEMLLVVNSEGRADVEAAAVEMLLDRQVDGIIYATRGFRGVQPVDSLRRVPTVLANCYDAEGALPSIGPDDRGGGATATEALIDAGHRRIAFISGRPAGPVAPAADERLAGYRAALDAAGLDFDPDLVRHSNWRPSGGYAETKARMALAEPPTGIFCVTDTVAIGAYEALKELGLGIPDDVAVVGYDNIELAAELTPPLTTVALPHMEMGRWAVERLAARCRGADPDGGDHTTLTCPLIARAST